MFSSSQNLSRYFILFIHWGSEYRNIFIVMRPTWTEPKLIKWILIFHSSYPFGEAMAYWESCVCFELLWLVPYSLDWCCTFSVTFWHSFSLFIENLLIICQLIAGCISIRTSWYGCVQNRPGECLQQVLSWYEMYQFAFLYKF